MRRRYLSLGVDVKAIQVPKHIGIVGEGVCVNRNPQMEQMRGRRAGGLQGIMSPSRYNGKAIHKQNLAYSPYCVSNIHHHTIHLMS